MSEFKKLTTIRWIFLFGSWNNIFGIVVFLHELNIFERIFDFDWQASEWRRLPD